MDTPVFFIIVYSLDDEESGTDMSVTPGTTFDDIRATARAMLEARPTRKAGKTAMWRVRFGQGFYSLEGRTWEAEAVLKAVQILSRLNHEERVALCAYLAFDDYLRSDAEAWFEKAYLGTHMDAAAWAEDHLRDVVPKGLVPFMDFEKYALTAQIHNEILVVDLPGGEVAVFQVR